MREQAQTGNRNKELLTHLEHLPAGPSVLGPVPVQAVHVHGALGRLKILREETRWSARRGDITSQKLLLFCQ